MKKLLIASLLAGLYATNAQADHVDFHTGSFDGFSNQDVYFQQMSGSSDIRGNVVYLGSAGSFVATFNGPVNSFGFTIDTIYQTFNGSLEDLRGYAPGKFEVSYYDTQGLLIHHEKFSAHGASPVTFLDSEFNKVVVDYVAPTFSYLKDTGNSADGTYGSVTALYQGELIFENCHYYFISNPTTPVPEPETYAMMLAGIGMLGLMKKKKFRVTG